MTIWKKCIQCGEVKTRTEFYPCRTTEDKRTDMCIECYKVKKEEKLLEKIKKVKQVKDKHLVPRMVSGIPASWAINKKTACTYPTSKCWLSYQKALCCRECLGYSTCESPYKCLNYPNKCTY